MWENAPSCTVGVISDTHGLLRPNALTQLKGVDLILHGGDVGKGFILEELRQIAPVFAVKGNVDYRLDVKHLPMTHEQIICGHKVYMIHIIQDLASDFVYEDCGLLIYGHSHRPSIKQQNGCTLLNPGSAGPVRFSLPVTLARVKISPEKIHSEIISLS